MNAIAKTSSSQLFDRLNRLVALGPTDVPHVLARRLLKPKLHHSRLTRRVAGMAGVEVGGPSALFSKTGFMPLYEYAGRVDNINFSNDTLWEADLRDGQPFIFRDTAEPGKQWVSEAFDLNMYEDGQLDFVASSHMIEHSANPIRVLKEWLRVLRRGGTLILVAPDPRTSFDHRRPITPVRHLVEDFENRVLEDDLTHMEEILALHDLRLDRGCESRDVMRERMEGNLKIRGMHQHVFSEQTLSEVVAHAGFTVLASETVQRQHIVVFASPTED